MSEQKQIKKFNGLALTSIILSYVAVMLTSIGFMFMESEEMLFAAALSLVTCIPAFILQFKSRKQDSFILWKIIIFISLGLCILAFLLILLLLILSLFA